MELIYLNLHNACQVINRCEIQIVVFLFNLENILGKKLTMSNESFGLMAKTADRSHLFWYVLF